jgi:deoxyadenosine/deoxycytidine kinase
VDFQTVIVEGIPGAGKTSLSAELSRLLGSGTLHLTEPDEKNDANPYLADYYKNADRWAFTMQVHLLQARYRAHLQAQWHVKNGLGYGVLDRSYFGDVAFAYVQRRLGHLPEREFKTYLDLYDCMTANVQYPNVCVLLDVDPAVALARIDARMELEEGRVCEERITVEYLELLAEATERMMQALKEKGTQVIRVPWNKDRSTPEKRNGSVEKLAIEIHEMPRVREFTNLFNHRMT